MTSPAGTVSTVEVTPGVVELVIERSPLNILDDHLQAEFSRALLALRQRDDVIALVLRGAGGKAFSVGADLKEIARTPHSDPWSGAELGSHWTSILESLPFLTIASIDGLCLGGGLEIALCADVRIASPASQFGFPECRIGLIPGMGGTVRLPALVGPAWAKRLMMTGEKISAATGWRIGLVQDVVPEPRQACLDLAAEASLAAPLAQRQIKLLLAGGSDAASRLRAERDGWYRLAGTADRDEGIAAFIEHRPAVFTGH